MAQDLTKGAAPRISSRLLGIVCVVAAVTIFSVQDMAIKWLSGGYPLHEIVFIRAGVAICLTLAILVPLEGGYRNLLSKRIPLHLLRGFALVCSAGLFVVYRESRTKGSSFQPRASSSHSNNRSNPPNG